MSTFIIITSIILTYVIFKLRFVLILSVKIIYNWFWIMYDDLQTSKQVSELATASSRNCFYRALEWRYPPTISNLI